MPQGPVRSVFKGFPLRLSAGLLAFVSITAAPAHAYGDLGSLDDSTGTLVTLPLFFQLNGSWGYASASGGNLSSSNSLVGWNAGVTVSVLIGGRFLIGLSSDYSSMAQYSDVSLNDGNLTGTRWNIVAPSLGLKLGNVVIQGNYQLQGTFQLSNPTFNGASVSYTHPSGFRAQLLYQLLSHVYAGVGYETIRYAKVANTQGGEMDLAPPLGMSTWNASVSIGF